MGTYKVIAEIDRGAFGIVERVADKHGVSLARKTFDPGPGVPSADLDKHRKRFTREVRYQGSLPTDFALAVLDFDLGGDHPWFVMPLADKNLEEQIMADKIAGVPSFKPIADLLNALEELHELDFVHRDIKPRNVLLHDGKWKLCDFGLVMPPSGSTTKLTSTNSAWGTQGYAAPEQVMDFKRVTPATDIYAVGCILHDLVSDGNRVPYSKVAAGGPLGMIIEKCTEVDPKRRFKSIRTLRSALMSVFAKPIKLQPSPETAEWIKALADYESWSDAQVADFTRYITTTGDEAELWGVFDSTNEEFWAWVFERDESHAEEIAMAYCDWTNDSFNFDYCDVVVRRLERVFDLGSTSVRGTAAVAAARLGYRHHRWFVMRRLRAMCGPHLDDAVANRIAIEMQANEAIEAFQGCLDGWTASDAFHPAIAELIADE